MKKLLLLICLVPLGVLLTPSYPSHAEKSAAIHEARFRKAKKPKHNEYIILLQRETPDSEIDEIANSLANSYGGSVMGIVRHAVKGFGVRMTEGAAKTLAKDPRVILIEENAQSEGFEEQVQEISGYQPYQGSEEIQPQAVQPSVPSWGLDRIDQRNNPFLDSTYHFDRTGQGVDAYIVDTGILYSHTEFGGRAIRGWDSWRLPTDPNYGLDCSGHGTQVAGIVGGRTYGVAKNVRLYSVRISDCNANATASAFTTLRGVDWSVGNYQAQTPKRPAVMNISLAFSYSDPFAGALETAVNNAIDQGITVAIAAGNFNWFTGDSSPQGGVPRALNVAATDINDQRWPNSNFGGLVDLFAPGANIPSSYVTSNTAIVTASGTSLSSPFVAGVAALYLEANPSASPNTVAAAIVNNATNGEVINSDPWNGFFTVNKLLYSLFIPPPPHIFVFNSSNQTVNEGVGAITITVNRSGPDLPAVTVDYATSDGTATQKGDYTLALGKLSFAAGETSKTFPIFITDDGHVENNETFTVTLSNPTGGASLGVPNQTTITIVSNDSVNSQPIDDARFFVKEHYRDFLNRDPDQAGWDFWTNEITSCGSNTQCIEIKRINVSAAFFLSIEFQQTGYLSYRFYNAALNRSNGLPRYLELMRDTQAVGRGVVVGASGWETQLETNKVAYANEFVSRLEFTALYPTSLTAAQFVDALYAHAGITPSSAERQAAIDEFNNPTGARGRVLRRVADNQTFFQRETNRAFVLMQYFGYLRRNPDDPPDNNLGGYNFWLDKLNQFNGNFVDAEMVKGFLTSIEYRQRFGP